ncbi:MAG: RHS repeat-associated core domain-containing protein, partial [Muribaculaceae bacterium]
VVESTDYYPYGTPFTTANSVQLYKYGTKELDRMHGLDLIDSQARWYDSLLGRTSTMDPLAEKYYGLSPYAWCAGNPVKFVDENGQEFGDIYYTRDDAAIDFGKCYNGISIIEKIEYVTNIYIFLEPEGTVAFTDS